MKNFLLIGIFSLCLIKESTAAEVNSSDCEKTYSSLILLNQSVAKANRRIKYLNKEIRKAEKSKKKTNVEKYKAEIAQINKFETQLTDSVNSEHIDTSCLLNKDFNSKFEAFKKSNNSQKRLKKVVNKLKAR
jgi:hypothetical protein